MAKLRIWTEAFRPFTLGGDVHAPIATEVEVGEAIDIGQNLTAYVVVNPITGQTHVAEAGTGAFVGTSIQEVRCDVASAAPEVLQQQLAEAAKRSKKATALTPEKFWALFK